MRQTAEGRWRGMVRIIEVLWLPLFVLFGVSWLLAPALAHEHYGTLRLISTEEAEQIRYGWVFRSADVLGAVLLGFAVWRFMIFRRAQSLAMVLLIIAVLSAIDGIFPDTCYLVQAACSGSAAFASLVHGIETIILGGIIGGLSLYDAFWGRRAVSIWFVLLQAIFGLCFAVGGSHAQLSILLQYAYEFVVIVWLGWLVSHFVPPTRLAEQPARWLRRIFGLWVLLSGIVSLLTAVPHLRLVHHLRSLAVPHGSLAIERHGIITGILLLYVARHILRGERPAAWLLLVIFAVQTITYSVLSPQPILMVASMISFLVLLLLRNNFERNTEPPVLTSRLKDIAVVCGGVLTAAMFAVLLAIATGRSARLFRDVQHVYGRPYYQLVEREDRLSAIHETQLRAVFETLAVSVGAVILWSLFRPRAWLPSGSAMIEGRQRMRALLDVYSDNSEDFFKLWPQDKSYYFDSLQNGMVAYRVVGGIAFALADPVAPSASARAATLQSFLAYVRQSGWTACFLLVRTAAQPLYEARDLRLLRVGSSAVIDTARFVSQVSHTKWWRWQRNRATRNGWRTEVAEPPYGSGLLSELREVSDAWLSREGRTEQGFALGYFDEAYLQRCRLHVLRSAEGRLIAFANEMPVLAGAKQASVDLIRFLPGEDGAMPVLLSRLIEQLHEEGYGTFDLGFVPLAGLESNLARLARLLGANRFSAAGLEQFKNKFQPDWQPNYIAYDGDVIDLARIAANLERLFAVKPPDSGGVYS